MTGIFQHSIDAKGRLFIPARLREELGNIFYVTLSTEKCLWAHSPESWNRMMERIEAMPRNQQIKMRPLFSHATKCEPDGQGRILLPKGLRDRAKLKTSVTVVGVFDRAEIWDSEMWDAVDMSESTTENLEQVFLELDF